MSFHRGMLYFFTGLTQAFITVCFGARIIPVPYQIFGENGIVTSPNFPKSYPNYTITLWNIKVPAGRQIKLNFTFFHLSPSNICDKDFVKIQDGIHSTSDLIVRLCGHQPPGKTVFSTGRHLQIYFETDATDSDKGFKAFYEAVVLTHSSIEEVQRKKSNCSAGIKGRVKECRCERDESNGMLYLRINCSSLNFPLIPTGDFPIITKVLDLTRNKLQNIEGANFTGLQRLSVLNLANNWIDSLANGSFQSLTTLTDLDLSKNRLQRVHWKMFVGLHLSLMSLNLGENELQKLDENSFKFLFLLIYLNLRENKIQEILEKTFEHQIFLTTLNLAGNYLKQIHSSGLANLANRKLYSLDFSYNQILKIPTKEISWQRSLEILKLGHNNISEVTFGELPYIPELTFLDLSHNKIEAIHPAAFKGVPKVFMLLLGSNWISTLENGTLTEMPLLKYVDLSRNRISTIEDHYFRGLFHLSFLNLAYNPLCKIEEGSFRSTANLKYLILMFTSIDVLWAHLLTGPRDLLVEVKPAKEVVDYELDLPRSIETVMSSSGYQCTYHGNNVNTCRPCPLGTYGANTECNECPAGGVYQDELGYSGRSSQGLGCKSCPVGHYVPPQDAPGKAVRECVLCPQGTDYTRYAGFKGCECLPNFYRLDRFGGCTRCPLRGLSCQNESVKLQPGFFWKWPSNESLELYQRFSRDLLITNTSYKIAIFDGKIPEVYACPLPEACLGGTESRCSHGYDGPLCAVCSNGYYKLLNYCRKCPRMLWFILQLCGILIVIAIFSASLVLARKKKSNSHRNVSDMILARLKILIGFYQATSGTLNAFSYVEWPVALLTVVQYANVVQLNLLQIIPLQCFFDNVTINAYTRFLIAVGSNTTVLFLAVFIYQLRKRVHCRNTALSENQLAESIACIKTQTYRVVCLVIFITYPWTCDAIFQLLSPSCQPICSSEGNSSCQYFLRADFTVQCFTTKYNKYMTAVYLLLAVVTALPGIIFFLLWKYHHKRIHPEEGAQIYKGREISLGLSFLYENYAPNCWFWEIIELLRKVWLTSVLSLMGAETRSHLGAAAIASGIYCILVAYYKPISDNLEHWLQLISLLAIFVTMNIGMLLKIPNEETYSSDVTGRDSSFLTVVLVTVNVTVIGIMLVQYMSTLITAIKRLRSHPQCGPECCVSFLTQMIGASGDVTNIETTEESPGSIELQRTSVR
ncbi:uncharacterized protein [Montipora foliosa]|uniref:uncharacterized protein n=1 Tax=Montipora foliosa TaxID=591990 RepID=UPI0035F164D4